LHLNCIGERRKLHRRGCKLHRGRCKLNRRRCSLGAVCTQTAPGLLQTAPGAVQTAPGRCRLHRGRCKLHRRQCSLGAVCTQSAPRAVQPGAVHSAPFEVQVECTSQPTCTGGALVWVRFAAKLYMYPCNLGAHRLHRHRCNLDRSVLNLLTFRYHVGACRTHKLCGLYPHSKSRDIQGKLLSACPSLFAVCPIWHKNRRW
jgi:hypothetical protein